MTVQTQLLAVWRQKSGWPETHWGCDQNPQPYEYFLGQTQQPGTFERGRFIRKLWLQQTDEKAYWCKCLPWVYLPTSFNMGLDKCLHTHWPNLFISKLPVLFAFIALSINASSSVLTWVLGSVESLEYLQPTDGIGGYFHCSGFVICSISNW